jgi:ABC-2 type transport system ATP-binding protein
MAAATSSRTPFSTTLLYTSRSHATSTLGLSVLRLATRQRIVSRGNDSDNPVMESADTPSLTQTRTNRGSCLLDGSGLTVQHGNKRLISDVSLRLRKAEVLGLLGLNGAGKSTTLKVLCGLIVPCRGTISVNGYDMSESPLMARSQIGYLPDQPPVYNDMRVTEYLKLCGQIRGLSGRTLRDRQSAVLEQCSLDDVKGQLIGSLSKGYRQRVGLAQAIIHQPAVILLDEPGNGLDPQQLENMRRLIATLGQQSAVVFSTHSLADVKTTCDRIALIRDGRLVTDNLSREDDLEALFRGDSE